MTMLADPPPIPAPRKLPPHPLAPFLEAYGAKPLDLWTDNILWAKHLFGVTFWSKMEEIFRSVVVNKKTCVWSCNGVSKTESSAILDVLWVLSHYPSYAVVTSSSWDTALQTLIPRIRNRANAVRKFFPFLHEPGMREWWPLGKNHEWAIICASPEERENIAGRHNAFVFGNVDEGSAMRRDIMGGIDGITVRSDDRILMTGNPLLNTGVMYEAGTIHMKKGPEDIYGWNRIIIAATDSPNYIERREVVPNLVGYEWVEGKRKEWANNPEEFYPRILGLPPPETERTIISAAAINRAAEVVPEPDDPDDPLILSVDPTSVGRDKASFAIRNSKRLVHLESKGGMNGPKILARILEIEMEFPGITKIIIDSTGNPSVAQFLEAAGHTKIKTLVYSQRARDAKRFANTRAEFHYVFRDALAAGFHVPMEYRDILVSQSGVQKKIEGNRITLEKKEHVRDRIGRSPDEMDSVAQSFYLEPGDPVFEAVADVHKMKLEPHVYPAADGGKWLINFKGGGPQTERSGELARVMVIKENDESAVLWIHVEKVPFVLNGAAAIGRRVTVYRSLCGGSSTPELLAQMAGLSGTERYALDTMTAAQGINALWRVQSAIEATGQRGASLPDFVPYAKIVGTEGVDYLDRLHLGTLARYPHHPYWRGDEAAPKPFATRPDFILYWPDDVIRAVRDARFLEPSQSVNESERRERIVNGGGAYVLALRLFGVVESGEV